MSRLQPLSAVGREIFAPLGLDSWVPGVTAAPPAVAPVSGPLPVPAAPVSVPPLPPGSTRALPQS